MNKKLLSLYGLKWNPFSPDLPIEALRVVPKVQSFCWRIEQALVREGGFALITGDPGTGKSVVLRILAERLEALRDDRQPERLARGADAKVDLILARAVAVVDVARIAEVGELGGERCTGAIEYLDVAMRQLDRQRGSRG